MKERRTAVRYKLAMPILVRQVPALSESPSFRGKARDISTHGLHFTTLERLTLGTRFEFTLELPVEITGGIRVLIVAQASVIRVESQRESELESASIGAVIERFDIMRSVAATT